MIRMIMDLVQSWLRRLKNGVSHGLVLDSLLSLGSKKFAYADN